MEPLQFAPRAVALGASAGAVEALLQILPELPQHFPLPLFIVVHVPATAPSLLCQLFAQRCRIRVCEVEDKMPIEAGTAYFAPPDYHLLIENERELALSIDPPIRFSRPSIDLMFESVAAVYGAHALGVVLSGANEDGAHGLAALAAKGARTIVQEPASARSPTMPTSALARVPSSVQLAPSAIAALLCELVSDLT